MSRYGPFVLVLAGLALPAVIAFVIALRGTPHVALQYSFLDNGDRWNVAAPRFYTSCTYFGLTGAHEVAARGGNCPWLKLIKQDGRR